MKSHWVYVKEKPELGPVRAWVSVSDRVLFDGSAAVMLTTIPPFRLADPAQLEQVLSHHRKLEKSMELLRQARRKIKKVLAELDELDMITCNVHVDSEGPLIVARNWFRFLPCHP